MGSTTSVTYLDILEIYNLKHDKDLDDITAVFDGIDIDERVDVGILAGTILDECGAMRCIYNTSQTFKYFSDNFFARNKEAISRVLDALEVKYNPLESINFDWTETTGINQNLDTDESILEDRTKRNTGTQTTRNTGSSTVTETGSEDKVKTGNTTTSETGSTSKENTGTQATEASGIEDSTVSAMNENTYQPDSHRTTSSDEVRTDNLEEVMTKNLTTEEGEHTSEELTKNLATQTTDNLSEEVEDDKSENINANNNRNKNEVLTWNETDTHNERGSKGFAYQDLIQKELKIRNFSIYSWIAKKYAKDMFLLIY